MKPKRPSQNSIIAQELTRRHGEWVPLLHLEKISRAHAVHSRASNLRGEKWNMDVRNRKEWVNGVCHSSYMLK